MEPESKLVEHARRELLKHGMFDEDADYGGELAIGVMKLMELFASQGHSGMSAELTIQLFSKLVRFEEL